MYEVTLVVTDSMSKSAEQEVTVKVTNVEEPGTIELSPLQPRVGFPVTATLTDPDNVTAGSVSWHWYRGNNIVTTSLPAECAETTDNNCVIKEEICPTRLLADTPVETERHSEDMGGSPDPSWK